MNKKYLFFIVIILVIVFFIVFKSNILDNSNDNKINNNENNSKKIDKNENKNNDKDSVTKLTFVGDLLFEQPFYDAIKNGDDKNEYFSLVKDYFKNDDISVGNMEVVIGNDNLKTSGTGFNFCAPKYIGDLVKTLDFEILGTANNHSYDRGKEGILSTIDYFKENSDILTVGSFKNKDERNNKRIITKNGIKFGFLAYTYGTNQIPKDGDEDLISYYKDPSTKKINKKLLTEEINSLKKESDIVIVLMHWGLEFRYDATNEQKEMANFLNSLGVDIIVGSHSHCIEPIEIIGEEHKTLVYYSLGNFVSSDDDISRTPKGEEEFDNAYQVGMISTLEIDSNKNFKNVKTKLVVNYFDKDMRNFKLIPLENYNEEYEKSHYRYSYGLNKDFINNMYKKVISEDFR